MVKKTYIHEYNGFDMHQYEPLRKSRYQEAKSLPMKHDAETFLKVYYAWISDIGNRDNTWDAYCDVRDGFPIGTNKHLRTRFQSSIARRYAN